MRHVGSNDNEGSGEGASEAAVPSGNLSPRGSVKGLDDDWSNAPLPRLARLPAKDGNPPGLSMTLVVGFYALMALAAIGLFELSFPELSILRPCEPMIDLPRPLRLGIGVGTGLGLVSLSRWLVQQKAWAKALELEMASVVERDSALRAAVFAVASGIGEELLFRGLAYASLGYVASSVVFGLLHIGPNRRWIPWTGLAIFAGFVFGALIALTGDVLAAIVAHAVVNYLNFRALGRRAEQPTST